MPLTNTMQEPVRKPAKAAASSEASGEQLSRAGGDAGRVNFAKYYRPELIDAIDRLSSPVYQAKQLVKPSASIVMRSLREQNKNESNRQPTGISNRIIEFVFVAIPKALLAGSCYGVANLSRQVWADIVVTVTTMYALATMMVSDIHQQGGPGAALTTVFGEFESQALRPYTSELMKRKLGPLGFISGPMTYATIGIAKAITMLGITVLTLAVSPWMAKHKAVSSRSQKLTHSS